MSRRSNSFLADASGWDGNRDAARKLSPVRDAEALLESLHPLRQRFADRLDDHEFHGVRVRIGVYGSAWRTA